MVALNSLSAVLFTVALAPTGPSGTVAEEKVKVAVGPAVVEVSSDVLNGSGEALEATFKDIFAPPLGDTAKGATVIMYRRSMTRPHFRGFRIGDRITNFANIHFKEVWASPLGIDLHTWVEWNDKVSSMKVLPGTIVICYEHAGFGGRSLVVGGGREGTTLKLMPDGWDNCISSCIVVDATPEGLKKAFR